MSIVWPGALRWTAIASRPLRCSSGQKFDSLCSRIVQTTKASYHSSPPSPSRSIQSFIIRSNGSRFPLTPRNAFAFPNRTLRNQRSIPAAVITEYQDLPADYEDGTGLDFRNHPLSQKEVTQWFGPGVDARTANTALGILHGRRVAGTLDDPAYADHAGIQEKLKQDALAWLRKNVPVDEIQNAGLRAEAELAAMDQELIAESQRFGIYKPNQYPEEYKQESALDNIKRIKDEEYEAKLAEKAELEKAQEQADEVEQVSGDLTVTDLRSQVELRRPGEHPWLKYYEKKAESVVPNELPPMSKTARLLPSGIFTLVTVIGCIIFAATYTPPTHRTMPDVPPAAATVMALITINAVFLLAWRMPPLWAVLNKYMLVVPGYPRAAAILGNVFSHQTVTHYASNMFFLWVIGTRLGDQIGRGDFLAIYLSAGVLGAFLSMTSYVMRGMYTSSHLGASGAVSGIIAAFCWINMDQKLEWAFLPAEWMKPLPEYTSIVILGVMVFLELVSLRVAAARGLNQTVDNVCHLGGYFTGIAGGEIVRRKMKARQQEKHKMLMMKERDVLGRTL